MDEYKNLNWSKNNPRSEAKLLEQSSIDFAVYQDDIFNLHINEIDPIHRIEDSFSDFTEQLEMPIDPRTGQTVLDLEVEANKPLRLFDQFPSGSRLRVNEHQHCLAVLNRINMRLPFTGPKESKDYSRYLSIMSKLAPERELFDDFVRNYFLTNLLGRVKNIEANLDEMVVKIWQKKIEEISSARVLDGKYRLMTAVAFRGYEECATNVGFEPAGRDVLETGSVRNLFTENVLRCVTLRRNQRILDSFVNEWCNARRRKSDEVSDVYSILRDSPEVSLVMPAGALTLLLNSARNIQEQWTIPFRVESLEGRKVLVIDSKLPSTKLSTHARKVKAYKLLTKSFMTFPSNEQRTEPTRDSTSAGAPEQNEVHFKPVSFDEYLKRVECRDSCRRTQVRESRFFQPWKLKEGDENHFLFIYYRQDCYESFRKERIFMNISVKLDYQPEFGAQQMTQAELLQEWGRQLLRPNSKTLRLRVNPMTHTIISHHYLELRDIEEELARLYGIQPRNLITNVWNTLKLLLSFPPGEYLLQRDGKTSQGLSVYARDDGKLPAGGVLLDFGQLMRSVEYECPPLEQYEWVPIDKFVITKLHRENTLLPCSFPHWEYVRYLESRKCYKPKPAARKPTQNGTVSKKKGAQESGSTGTTKEKSNDSKPEGAGQPSRKPVTAGQLLRKEKKKKLKLEQSQQKALAEKIRYSLDQYAPYEGPAAGPSAKPSRVASLATREGGVRKDNFTTAGTSATPTASQETGSLIHSLPSKPVDYGSYAQQASLEPNE